MPYKIVKNHPSCPASKPWAVVKKSDGKKMGCHETRGQAAKQIAAIEVNTNEAHEPAVISFREVFRRFFEVQ